MDKPSKRYRVTLLDTFHGDNDFEFCRAVSEFAEPLRHWKFVGTVGFSQFSSWKELPWDKVDGVMALELDRSMAELAASTGVPTVSVTPHDLNAPLPKITTDFRAVGRLGAEHLLERGYANFAYLCDGSWRSTDQREAFEQTIRRAGRTCVTRKVEESSATAILNFLRDWLPELPKPIGIMTAVDYLARYVANVAIELGLRVPGEVGILGVNNNRWASIMAAAPISSVDFDQRRLGQMSARTLDALMQGQAVEPLQQVAPLRVVMRRSTDTVIMKHPLVAQAMQFIRDHAAEGIDVNDVLADVGCSRSTLEKRFKHELGYSVHTAITRTRIEKAKQMLANTEASTDQIAHHCGFEYQARLFESFKRVTGMTPTAYRRSMRGVASGR